MLNHSNLKLDEFPIWLVSAIGIVILMLVGLLDYISGFEISMSFFYIIPIVLVAWYAGKNLGFTLSTLAGVILIFLDRVSGHHYSHPAILYWNAMLELASYFFIVHLVSKLRTSLNLEKQLARIDALTEIPNRLTFTEQLNSCFHFAERSKESFSLAYIDIDYFKNINDNYGHDAGDTILKLLATALRTPLRRTDIAARLGGDEFAVLLSNTDIAGAKNLIEIIQVTQQTIFRPLPMVVTVSIGATTFERLPESPEDAVKIADKLMYEVKQNGRNSVRFSIYK